MLHWLYNACRYALGCYVAAVVLLAIRAIRGHGVIWNMQDVFLYLAAPVTIPLLLCMLTQIVVGFGGMEWPLAIEAWLVFVGAQVAVFWATRFLRRRTRRGPRTD